MLKLAVGEVLRLPIDYDVLVNLDGFVRLVDALGGITVNVNYYVPIGGEPTLGIYIPPGSDQHLDGAGALDFARGRYGMSDYDRMDRQRCAVKAIVDAADPVTPLWEYRELAATAEDRVSTDIPRSVLDDFVDLDLLIDHVEIRSVVFDDTVITPAYPDYDRIRALMQEALDPSQPPAGPGDSAPRESDEDGTHPATYIADACAYDPVQAEDPLTAGEPATRVG